MLIGVWCEWNIQVDELHSNDLHLNTPRTSLDFRVKCELKLDMTWILSSEGSQQEARKKIAKDSQAVVICITNP
jgi:hypothetical protein